MKLLILLCTALFLYSCNDSITYRPQKEVLTIIKSENSIDPSIGKYYYILTENTSATHISLYTDSVYKLNDTLILIKKRK